MEELMERDSGNPTVQSAEKMTAEELQRALEEALKKIEVLENTKTPSFNRFPKVELLGVGLAVAATLMPIGALVLKSIKELKHTPVPKPSAKDLLYDYAEASALEEQQKALDMRMHEIMDEVEEKDSEHLAERYARALRDEQERKARNRAERKIVDAVKKSTTTNGSELKDEI
jgi:hypothetical protein